MSFLLDPPWLYANGRVLAHMPAKAKTPLAAATLTTFLVTSVSLYFDKPWTRRISRACRAEDGRDWMLNSGVFKIDHRAAGTATHLVSGALFATYPLWLWLGMRDGRK
jgi:hypothetical protein